MERVDCLKALVPHIKDQLVVITLGRTALEWADVCPREGNMFSSGMGNHIPVALGLAKALPHRQIILLDSDGSVLMLLPALTTLGSFPAPNLKIFVFDNEAYEGTGGQPSDTARVADIAAMAQGAGVTGAKTVKDLDSFIGAAQEALNKEGMTFIVVKVELSKGPAPRKGVGHKEDLLQFVRYVEKTENLKVLHSEHY
ncbi:MAG TPA: thiamine pyrophosphate-dependent enzyme [Candidatus Saccharimonadales bacterium]|jgi:sulfopyruvate decarboxylase subunit beta|nr:thiamine pyrophosphate-dependent enzyme [Candidatus Saccharimonadales bacterium]